MTPIMAAAMLSELDTSNCETEPIRFSGAIQPHGALLVLHATSGIIEAASDSCTAFLGAAVASLLGRPVRDVLGDVAQAALLRDTCDRRQPPVPFVLHGRNLRARPSINEAGRMLIDIEADGPDCPGLKNGYHRRQVISQLRELSDIRAIAERATQLMRSVTNYDRVLLYRFDETNISLVYCLDHRV